MTTSSTVASAAGEARGISRAGAGAAGLADVAARVRKHVPGLDGLRGLAILVVLIHTPGTLHQVAAAWYMKALFYVHAPGWAGVQLFFVLSGFLITGLLLDAKGKAHALRSFWIRRALRIFPIYYAVLLVTTVIAPSLISNTPEDVQVVLRERLWYWLYLSNWTGPSGHEIGAFSHFWSLAVEEQFYLVWPAVVMMVDRRTLLRLSLAMAVIAVLVRLGLRAGGAPPFSAYEYTVARMDALTLGAAGALVVRDESLLAKVAPYTMRALVGGLVVVGLLYPVTHGFNLANPLTQVVGYSALSVACLGLLLHVVIQPKSALGTAFQAPWLRFFGKYSYGIYVFHHPFVERLAPHYKPLINSSDPHAALLSFLEFEVVVIVGSVVIALISWNVLERWALQLKDIWAPTAANTTRTT
jgi:peptidoglycan/LPS O-acetylase OafA/YrhL